MNKRKTNESIKNDLADYYDQFAIEYREAHYSDTNRYAPLQFRQHYIEAMIEIQGLPEGAKILDVGCGPGELTLSLLQKGHSVWAVDISQSMTEAAVRTVNANGFPDWNQVSVGDIESLEFDDDYFDVVVAAGVLEYQKDDDRSLSEMQRVLKTDGCLILNVTNKFSPIRVLGMPYNWSKQWGPSRAVLGFMKSRVLGRGSVNPLPDHRAHSPGKFDRKLAESGFEKLSHNYFHFSPVPAPFSVLFIFISSPVGAWMEKLTRGPLGFLGGGYIVLTRNRR